MIDKLEACVLPVSDLDGSLTFYSERLGFEVVDRRDGESAILRAGDAELVLLSPRATEREPKFAGASPGGAIAIHFRVPDVERMWESVSGSATVLERIGDREYGDRDFTLADPDGYRLVFGTALLG